MQFNNKIGICYTCVYIVTRGLSKGCEFEGGVARGDVQLNYKPDGNLEDALCKYYTHGVLNKVIFSSYFQPLVWERVFRVHKALQQAVPFSTFNFIISNYFR